MKENLPKRISRKVLAQWLPVLLTVVLSLQLYLSLSARHLNKQLYIESSEAQGSFNAQFASDAGEQHDHYPWSGESGESVENEPNESKEDTQNSSNASNWGADFPFGFILAEAKDFRVNASPFEGELIPFYILYHSWKSFLS